MASELVSPGWDKNSRFAINWRAFWLISLVMTGLVLCVFYAVVSLNEQHYESARLEAHDKYQRQLDRLIESSADKMIQLSGAVSFNNGLMNAINNADSSAYLNELDNLDWNLQTDTGMRVIGLFDLDGQNLYTFGEQGHGYFAKEVIKQEQPQWFVDCATECRIVTYTALLHQGDVAGVLSLSEPLSNVMLRFNKVANIDTGLLQSSVERESQLIPDWQRSLVALTNPEESREVLRQAAKDYSLKELNEGVGLVRLNNAMYELKAMPLKDNEVVVISDVSDNYMQFNQSKSETIRMSAAALVLSEILLLMFLWRPLKKIRITEQLEDYVSEQADILKEKTLALTKAQNLSENLCDSLTAAVLILDGKGRIQFSNRFFKRTIGLPASKINHRQVFDLIDGGNSYVRERLADVQSGRIDEYEHIGTVLSARKQSHRLMWRYVPTYRSESGQDWAESSITSDTPQSVVVIGVPIASPTLVSDQIRQERTDPKTGMLNRTGLCHAINEASRTNAATYALSLIRLPDELFTTDQRVQGLNRALSLFAARLGDNVQAAQLDLNEIAVLYATETSEAESKAEEWYLNLLIDSAQELGVDVSQLRIGSGPLLATEQHPHQLIQRVQSKCN